MKVIYFLLLCLLLTGCSYDNKCKTEAGNVNTTNSYYPIAVTNYASNRQKIQEVFKEKPKRVIAHHQNVIEAMIAIDEEKSIVAGAFAGTDTRMFSKEYQEKVKEIPVIYEYGFDLETVLMYQPDLIIGWQSTFSPRTLRTTDFWHKRGVNTYILGNSNAILPVGTVEDEIIFLDDMGRIFNRQKESARLIKEIRDELAYVHEQTKGRTVQKVLVIEILGNNIVTYDENRLSGDMLKKLGAQLINCGRTIDAETLIALNPDVIFVVNAKGLLEDDYAIKKITGNKALRSINAIKNKRVYAIPLIYMYASGTRTIDGIRTFRNGLYPEMKGR